MENDIKYNLVTSCGYTLGYFLNNKFYSSMFGDLGYEAYVENNQVFNTNAPNIVCARIENNKYIQLSDGQVMNIVKSV